MRRRHRDPDARFARTPGRLIAVMSGATALLFAATMVLTADRPQKPQGAHSRSMKGPPR
ncbi:MAG: hypothetical protein SGJ23_05530 [Alphaproteobacteria bacterium]|nr:hypothetical protein [Alphaproteobacteria bacterium]